MKRILQAFQLLGLIALCILCMAPFVPNTFTENNPGQFPLFLPTSANTDNASVVLHVDGKGDVLESRTTVYSNGVWLGPLTQTWTNYQQGQIGPYPSTNEIFLGDISQLGVTADLFEGHATNANATIGVEVIKNVTGQRVSARSAISATLTGAPSQNSQGSSGIGVIGQNNAGGIGEGGSTYYQDSSIGVLGTSGTSQDGSTNSAMGLYGYANGNEGLLVGTLGEADAAVNGTTNVGSINNVLTEGKTGTFVAHYSEIRLTPAADGSDDPTLVTSVEEWDNRESNFPLLTARTNGVTVATIDTNGVFTANGLVDDGQFSSSTNTFSGPTNSINMLIYRQSYQTVTPVQFSAYINISTTLGREVILSIYNNSSSNITATYGQGVTDRDFNSQYTITNGNKGVFWLQVDPSLKKGTNIVANQF